MERRTLLTTERTRLTTWRPGDLDELHALHSDPETMRWVRPGRPETPEESEQRLAGYLLEQRDPGWTKWRVESPAGELLGRAGFGGRQPRRELGYTLAPAASGRGLATEVTIGLLAWHRSHPAPGWDAEVTAYAALANAASCRVLEKAGFVVVGEAQHNDLPCAVYEHR